MNGFRTWLVCEPRYASLIEKITIGDEFTLSTSDDPSFRHWCSTDGNAVTIIEQECSNEEEKMQAQNFVRAKEVIINCEKEETADNFVSLIHAGILLGYPMNLNFHPISETCEVGYIKNELLRKSPMHKWFTYHENVFYGCLLAKRAWRNPSVRYAMHKWRLSLDLDSFTPHSASPRQGQIFPTHYPDDTYHVKAAFAVIAAFSAIEELGLEVRSSAKKPRFVGDAKDQWNPDVFEDIEKRLREIGIDPSEKFEWVVRGQQRTIENEFKPVLGKGSSWGNDDDVRDRTLSIVDAIHYSSLVRNFIAAHKFSKFVGELGPYDVFNVQSIARRLIMSSLGVWMKGIDDIVN